MSLFLKPGQLGKSGFGISFDTDRDAGSSEFINQPPQSSANVHAARSALPVARYRKQILHLVEEHATTVIVGETGSGKTTQIPQFLHEAGWTAGGRKIACTQPRRLAAMTVASRVAEEMGTSVGGKVGYSIRFEDLSTPGVTCIRFCTDGVLLREMMQDPLLSSYSVIMIDEAHERSLATDLLLGLLKKVQERRKDLRVIVASATLQAKKVADFFDTSTSKSETFQKPALLSIEGRSHGVQIFYLQQPAPDYVLMAVHAASELHCGDLPGDILIFLTGQDECEQAVSLLEEEAKKFRKRAQGLKMFPIPLYAGLPSANQMQVFEAAPREYRKVIVATNIAETSLTIEGIVFVIDSCFSKQSIYNPLTGLRSLVVGPISQASGSQRAGRAGRIRPGFCLRLCTEESYQSLAKETVPEMQRTDPAGALLQLKAMGIHNIMKFDFLDAPPAEAIIRALELLYALGALDDDARLTSIGQQMADLPLDPRLGRALIASIQLQCSEEVSAILAVLSVQSIWFSGQGVKALDNAKRKFAMGEGDLIAYLNVWEAWKGAGEGRPSWAHRHCLNHKTLLRVADIRSQLLAYIRRLGHEPKSCEGNVETIQKALVHGLFANAANFEKTEYNDAQKHRTGYDVYKLIHNTGPGVAPKLRISAESTLFRTQPSYVLFWQIQQSTSGFFDMSDILAIEPEWLPEIAPAMYKSLSLKSHR